MSCACNQVAMCGKSAGLAHLAQCRGTLGRSSAFLRLHAPVGRAVCRVVAMSKRGPKSERRRQEGEKAAPPAELVQAGDEAPRASEPQQTLHQPQRAVVADTGAVGDRILKRILLFSGLPVFLGLLVLPGFYYLKVVQQIDVPTWVVYIASFLTFGVGLGGISYGVLSSSWVAEEEGSLGGVEEFKENLEVLRKGKGR